MQKPAITQQAIHDLLANRWSGRAYDAAQSVSKEQVVSLLEAARWAPSCFGDQPWRYVVCNKADNLQAWQAAFDCLVPGNQSWAVDAPVLLLICADTLFSHNDKPNKWAGHTNWGKNTNRMKSGELKVTTDIKPVPEFSPRNNIWKYTVGKGFISSDKESHNPAIFPEQLAEDHIKTWSNENDIVLDPFSGSGTTCKMAKKNKRRYIGIDISKEYCKLAETIIAKYH
jgi:hypothetical protein